MKRRIFGILAVIIAMFILAVPAFAKDIESKETADGGYYMPHFLFGDELDALFEGLSEEDVLAKFIQYEGGEMFEKTLIAEIVCDYKKDWEVDTIQEVLKHNRFFAIAEEGWNAFEIPSRESMMIAHTVLEASKYQETRLSIYSEYYYPEAMNIELENRIINGREYFKTRNFIFVER